jgi:hypothetical protein
MHLKPEATQNRLQLPRWMAAIGSTALFWLLANYGHIAPITVTAGTIPSASPTPELTASPATETPTPPATVTPGPSETPIPSVTPSATSAPSPTETMTPPATETPTPTPTETPIPTPELPPINPREFYHSLLSFYPFFVEVETTCDAPDGTKVLKVILQQSGNVPGYQVKTDNPAALAAAFVLQITKPTSGDLRPVDDNSCLFDDYGVAANFEEGPSSSAPSSSGALVNLNIANISDFPPEVNKVQDENPIAVRLFIPYQKSIVARVTSSSGGVYFVALSPSGLIVDGVHEFVFSIVLGRDDTFVVDIFGGELPTHVDEGDLLASQKVDTELNVPAPLTIGTSQVATITRIKGGQYEQIEVQTFVINSFPALIIRSNSPHTGSFLIDFNPPARSVGMDEGFAFFTVVNGILEKVKPPLDANIPYIYGPQDLEGFDFGEMDHELFLNLVISN